MGRLAGRLPGHTGGVSNEQRGDADQLAAAADEVEAGRGPVAVSRPGHKLVVLISAEQWQRLEELESARQRRGGGVMRPSVLTQVRSRGRGRGRKALVWMRPSSGAASLICSATPAPRDRASGVRR